jgi:hypothetical protein
VLDRKLLGPSLTSSRSALCVLKVGFRATAERCCPGLAGARPEPQVYSESAERIHGDH